MKNILILLLFLLLININGFNLVRHENLYINVDNITTYRILSPLEFLSNNFIQVDFSK